MSQLTCTKCKSTKDAAQFSKQKEKKTGYRSHCKSCEHDYYQANKAKTLARQREHRQVNKVKLAEFWRKHYQANKAEITKRTRAYYRVKKDIINPKNRAYKKANRDKYNAINAKRRAKKLQATPPWTTDADFAEIQSWYEAAAECQWLSSEPLHVDHIIPLQGKDVSGLHVSWNLQILPASENIRKGNKSC